MKKRLKRTVQCKTCPWKKNADPFKIPNGYSVDLHKNLEKTIADPCRISFGGGIKAMACHYSEPGEEDYCVGWLHNQLGVGNNIGLRIQMLHYENARDIQIVGEQHKCFNDTLPD